MTSSGSPPLRPRHSAGRQSSLDLRSGSGAPAAELQRCSVAEFARLVDRCVGECRRLDRSGLAVLWLQAVTLPRLEASSGAASRAAALALQESLGMRIQRSVRAADQVVMLDRGEVGVVLMGADPEMARNVQRRLVETLDAPFPLAAGIPAPTRLHTSLADFPRQGRSGSDLVRALHRSQTEVHPLTN